MSKITIISAVAATSYILVGALFPTSGLAKQAEMTFDNGSKYEVCLMD